MGKDPAFLFYPNDWIGGTMGMTFEEKGAYMELLMMQFNRGHMTSHMVGQVVGQIWDKIAGKFVQDENGLWYNKRLEDEVNARKSFVNSRKNNLKGTNQYTKKIGHMRGHVTSHMEDENVNENVNKNKKGVQGEKPKWAEGFKHFNPKLIYPFEYPSFAQAWDLWVDYKKEQHRFTYKPIGEQAALHGLSETCRTAEEAINDIHFSIKKGWKGIFKSTENGNNKNTEQSVLNIAEIVAAGYGRNRQG